MLKFNLPDSVYEKQLISAKLSFETIGEATGGEVRVIPISKEWSASTIDYYDIESDTITLASQYFLGTDGVANLDVTNYIKDLLLNNEQLKGLIVDFKNHIPFYDSDDEGDERSASNLPLNDLRAEMYQCDTVPLYGVYKGFSIGDLGISNGVVYKCTNLWCNSAGYQPGMGNGKITWKEIGNCIPRELRIHSAETEVGTLPELIITLKSSTSIFDTFGEVSKFSIKLKKGLLVIPKSLVGNSYQIVNVQGRIIKDELIQKTQIDISFLAKGVYTMSIKNKRTQFSFIKIN